MVNVPDVVWKEMVMSDVKCPYCGHEQEINHDDGYGFEEDEQHEQECTNCGRRFEFTTSIIYSYSVHCKHKSEHQMVNEYKDLWECEKCDYYEVRR